jgi:para-aminobenzoate synthetase component 1
MPSLVVPRAIEPARLLALHPTRRRPVVLDGAGPSSWGNGSALLTTDPRATLAVYADGRACITVDASVHWTNGRPFELWQRFLSDTPALLGSAGDPDAAGFVTVLSYDLKHWVESLPRRQRWPTCPILYCAFYDWVYRYDYRTWSAAMHAQSMAQAEGLLASLAADPPRQPSGPIEWQRLRPELNAGRYRERLAAIHRYIAAGDVYQVNFAQPFAAPASSRGAPTLFARMQHAFPMPFAAYVDAGDVIAASSSPECFLTVEGDRVATFPIKGTRALGPDAASDLRADPKEWAEHVMIVDLERNDLGRVCRTGSVEVADFGALHTYPLLAHLVSEVRGRLQPGITLPALMRATFPGGSITGAPKIRAMQIIEELELGPRGLYTGAIGWTDLNGNSRFNLAIRTAVFAGDTLTYHAGGGIVADSDAEREYDETLLKAEAMFRVMAAL